MNRIVKSLMVAAAIALLPAAFAGAAGTKSSVQPVVTIEQLAGFPEMTQFSGPVFVKYAISIENTLQEPITLDRIDLQTIGAVSPYQMGAGSRPYKVTIPAGEKATVTYMALAEAQGGMIGSMTPVNIKGTAQFTRNGERFVVTFMPLLSPATPERSTRPGNAGELNFL